MKRVLLSLVVGVCVYACGGSSSSPGTPTSTSTTRIIGLSGNLAFGTVAIGESATAILTITNSGNAVLTVSGMTVSGGSASAYTANFTSGAISAGATQPVSFRFTPTTATTYNGTLTVNGDQTGGSNTTPISGTGLGTAATPTTFSVNGTVTDGTSHGILPNITVQVVSGTNTGKTAVTDTGGNYLMSGLSAGTFTLSAAAASYQTTTQQVTLSASARVDLVLQRTVAPTPTPRYRIGATCNDGTASTATGSGACSSHGGVACWRYSDGTCTNP